MATDSSNPIVHPHIVRLEREIEHVEKDCASRHVRQNEVINGQATELKRAREILIEIAGREGGGGKIKVLEDDVGEVKELAVAAKAEAEAATAELKRIRSGQLRWSGAGAAGGGGLIVALFEALRALGVIG